MFVRKRHFKVKLHPLFRRTVKDEVDGVSAPKKTKSEPIDDKEKAELKKQVDRLQKYTRFLQSLTRTQISDIMEENAEPVLIQSSVSRCTLASCVVLWRQQVTIQTGTKIVLIVI